MSLPKRKGNTSRFGGTPRRLGSRNASTAVLAITPRCASSCFSCDSFPDTALRHPDDANSYPSTTPTAPVSPKCGLTARASERRGGQRDSASPNGWQPAFHGLGQYQIRRVPLPGFGMVWADEGGSVHDRGASAGEQIPPSGGKGLPVAAVSVYQSHLAHRVQLHGFVLGGLRLANLNRAATLPLGSVVDPGRLSTGLAPGY